MRYILALLLLIVITIFSITLGTQNDQVVKFNFLLAQGEYRLSILLAVLFGSGLVIGWLVTSLFYIRLRVRLIFARRQLKRFQHSTKKENNEQQKELISPLPLLPATQQTAGKE